MGKHYERGRVLHSQKRYAQAEQELRQELADDPNCALSHAMLALCLNERGQHGEAASEAERAVGLAPDLAFANYTLALIIRDRDRLEEAEKVAVEAVRLAPEDADYYSLLSCIRRRRGRWETALESAEHGLKIDPQHVWCAGNRAMALAGLGRMEEAQAAIEHALACAPDSDFTQECQGCICWLRGDHRKALEHYREALRLDPNSSGASDGLIRATKAGIPLYQRLRCLRGVVYGHWLVICCISLAGVVGFLALQGVARTHTGSNLLVWPLLLPALVLASLLFVEFPFDLLVLVNHTKQFTPPERLKIAYSCSFGVCLLGFTTSAFAWITTLETAALLGLPFSVMMMMPFKNLFDGNPDYPKSRLVVLSIVLAATGLTGIGLVFLGSRLGYVCLGGFAVGAFVSLFVGAKD